mmetsp:Transcript_28130/g.90543  ORF Transcript_28130/g.90543 Transcript_28130/m.90543 type:complete len:305 (+) Transcript_28130:689-1603(+)
MQQLRILNNLLLRDAGSTPFLGRLLLDPMLGLQEHWVVFLDHGEIVCDVQCECDGITNEDHQGDDLDGADRPTHNGNHEERQPADDPENEEEHNGREPWVPREEQHAEPAASRTENDGVHGALDDGHLCLCAHPCVCGVPSPVPRHGGHLVVAIHEFVPPLLVIQRLLCPHLFRVIRPELHLTSQHLLVDEPQVGLARVGVRRVPIDDVAVKVPRWELLANFHQVLLKLLDPTIPRDNPHLIRHIAHCHHGSLGPRIGGLEFVVEAPILLHWSHKLRRWPCHHSENDSDIDLLPLGHSRGDKVH